MTRQIRFVSAKFLRVGMILRSPDGRKRRIVRVNGDIVHYGLCGTLVMMPWTWEYLQAVHPTWTIDTTVQYCPKEAL